MKNIINAPLKAAEILAIINCLKECECSQKDIDYVLSSQRYLSITKRILSNVPYEISPQKDKELFKYLIVAILKNEKILTELSSVQDRECHL